MVGLMVTALIGMVWPLLVPLVFAIERRRELRSRFLFYILGVILCYGCRFVAPRIFASLVGFIGGITGNPEIALGLTMPGIVLGSFIYSAVLYAALGVLLSIVSLCILCRGFRLSPEELAHG